MEILMTKLPPLERGLQVLELAASHPEGFNWKQACACLGNVSTATVAKVLKVLTERRYLTQVGGKYKSGSTINRLIPSVNARDILLNHGPLLAKEFSDYINESCVIAIFDEDRFRFTGVQIIEGAMGYSPPGTIIYQQEGHVMTQVLHATENPEDIKSRLETGNFFFGYKGTAPKWREYSSVLSEGRKAGIFLEYGWRRPQSYRMAIPVFARDLSLVGAFMCGYSNKDMLLENIEKNFTCYLKVMSKISNYENTFNAGIKKIGN